MGCVQESILGFKIVYCLFQYYKTFSSEESIIPFYIFRWMKQVPEITIITTLSYLGLLFMIIGAFFILVGFGELKTEIISVTPSKKTRSIGIILFFLGVLLLVPDIAKQASESSSLLQLL